MNTAPRHQQPEAGPAPHVDPEDARAALEQASQAQVVAPRDRTVYAVGTALFGVALGIFAPLSRAIDDGRPGLLGLVYVVFVIGVAIWQTRAARSIPLGAKRKGYVGLAVMVVVAMTFIIALNWRERTTPTPVWLLVVNGVAVALPMLLAGLAIMRSRR